MGSSGSAYVFDQLGGESSPRQFRVESIRFRNTSRVSQSISNLLGREHPDVAANSRISYEPGESLGALAMVQNSAELAEDADYFNRLIDDREIAKIRFENQSLLDRLLSVYVFEDSAKVRSFLEDHPSTSSLLLEAIPFLRASFGVEAILQLQIPIDEDPPLTIYAVALWDGTLEDARRALDKFDAIWWTANCHRASGRIVIDYQLV